MGPVVDETKTLAEFVTGTQLSDVPEDVVERVKTYVLDTLAAGLVGCQLPWSQIVRDYEIDNSAGGPCSVFGSKETLSPSAASFVNGTMVGAFESEHSAHTAHPGGTVVPAALATAEAIGASGNDLALAMIVGYETVCRIGDAQTRLVEDERGFHNPAANGPFSSAAAVGKLLGLDTEHQLNAFGIAGSMAGGLIEFVADGSMTKRLHIGLGNRGGVDAAYLAKRGYTGPGTVLEGAFGYLHAFSPTPRPELLTVELGDRWMTREMKIKPYAAHGTVQAVIAALNELKAEQSIDPASVTSVHVKASTVRMLQKRFLSTAPRTLLQAQLSLPFVIATTLFRDLSDPLQFDESTLTDEAILRLAASVTWEEIETEDPHFAYIDLVAGGTTHEVFAGHYVGSEHQRATWDDVVDKFRRFSQHSLDTSRQQEVIDTVARLDTLSDVGELMVLVRV